MNEPPFPSHPEYMNGRLKKVDMTAHVMKMKTGIHNKEWFREWDDKERWAAQQALNCVLEVLDEYWY